MSSSQHMWNIK